MQTETQIKEPGHSGSTTVHVTVRYTSTADKKEFTTHLDETLQTVINQAYRELKQTPQSGDEYFCRNSRPRLDLKPYLGYTLKHMLNQGICVHEDHGKLVASIEIDADTGGAAR